MLMPMKPFFCPDKHLYIGLSGTELFGFIGMFRIVRAWNRLALRCQPALRSSNDSLSDHISHLHEPLFFASNVCFPAPDLVQPDGVRADSVPETLATNL